MNRDSRNLAVTLLRRPAGALVVVVLLLWGAFFIEHTQDWFVVPLPNRVPLSVCLAQPLRSEATACRRKLAEALVAQAFGRPDTSPADTIALAQSGIRREGSRR